MKRPALCIGFPYILGLTLGSFITGAVRLPLLGCLLLPGMAVLIWRRDLWKYVLLSTLSCLTACCVYWHADQQAAKLLHYAGTDCTCTGTVTDAVQYDSGYASYTLDAAFSDGTAARIIYLTRAACFSCGDSLTLSGTPTGFSSGYLFDSAANARSQGIFLQFGFDTGLVDFQTPETPTLRTTIRNWRDTMCRRIRTRMGDDTGAVLTGLLFGDKSGMSRESRTALYRMGIGHVMVVSGLHLDALAYAAAFLLQRLRAGRKTSFAVIGVLCILFVLLAGETVSVRRACIMALIGQSGRVLFRKPDNLNSLSIAMLILGLENPFVIHAAAFWLSCAATLGIAVIAPCMTRNLPRTTFPEVLFADLSMCCWCFLATLPVCIIYFREISLLSPISNTLLVPVCLGAMVCGILALPFGCHGAAAEVFLDGADVMLDWILRLSRAVSAVPWTHASTGSRMLLLSVFAGLALTVAVWLLGRNRRAVTFTVLCALLVSAVSVSAERIFRRNDLRIAVLGEENGTVLVIHNGYDAQIIDLTGQKRLSAYAEGCLTEEGIRRVHSLCLCRPSAKSIRQYAQSLRYFPPDTVWRLSDKECGELLGKTPVPAAEITSAFHGAEIVVQPHVTEVRYAGNVCRFTDAAELAAPAQVLYCCGGLPEQLPACGILFVPDSAGIPYDAHTRRAEDCTELTLTPDGRSRIRRLYGEN